MAETTLIAHRGAEIVTFDDLAQMPKPEPLGPRHYPVEHAALVAATRAELAKVGLVPAKETFAVGGPHGTRLFATMDLVRTETGPALIPANAAGERGLAFGLRHGNDQSLAIEMVAGSRVFVCDNMAFSGDSILLHRMHTKHVALQDEVARGIEKLLNRYETFEHNLARLENADLSDGDAKGMMVDAFLKVRVMAPRYMLQVYRWYFDPELDAPDCRPRTAWGLHNAFTRTVKSLPSESLRYDTTKRLGRYFGLRSDVRDALIGDTEVEDAEFEAVE